jgi:hypothetical protein
MRTACRREDCKGGGEREAREYEALAAEGRIRLSRKILLKKAEAHAVSQHWFNFDGNTKEIFLRG